MKAQEEPSSKELRISDLSGRAIKGGAQKKVAIPVNRAKENRFIGFTFTPANNARIDLDDGFPSSGRQKNKWKRIKL